MDEVNLSTRGGGPVARENHREPSESSRPVSKQSPASGQQAHNSMENQINRQFYQGIPPPAFDPMALQRTGSMDSNGFDQYPLNSINQPVFPQNSNMPLAAMASQQAQLQYHQAALAASRPNNFYPLMNGFQNSAPGLDAFRNVSPIAAPGMTGSPMLQQAGFGQGIGPVMSPQIYPYGMYMPQQQQQIATGQRRGRVSTVFHTTTSNVRWTAENLAELTEK